MWKMENQPLSAEEATKFRNVATTVNYLSADRTDLQYAAKDVCRSMAAPTRGS